MATLHELAIEYRKTAAMLALKVRQHEEMGDLPAEDLAILRAELRDTREVQHLLAGYYVIPRRGIYDCSSWKARGARDDDG